MKKKVFALLMAVAMSLGLLSACGTADSGVMDQANANAVSGGNSDLPVVTWKMGSTWGAGNVHFTVDQRFGEILSQLTGGRFTVTNYADGELCSASQLFDYVSQGTIECGGDWGGYWSGKDTAFELLSTIMDDFTALDYYTWIYEAGGMECYKEECEINPNFKMVYDSMQAYRETANNYRDWTGYYGFGFNREA